MLYGLIRRLNRCWASVMSCPMPMRCGPMPSGICVCQPSKVFWWKTDPPARARHWSMKALPLRDGALARAIIIHGLEAANHSNALLNEIWRILVPNGRAILLCPTAPACGRAEMPRPLGQVVRSVASNCAGSLKPPGFRLPASAPHNAATGVAAISGAPAVTRRTLAGADTAANRRCLGGRYCETSASTHSRQAATKYGAGCAGAPGLFARCSVTEKTGRARLAREFENHQFGHKVLPC